MKPAVRGKQAAEAGFSLVELLIVVTIIVVAAAVSLPAIGRYVRSYRIRGAAQQVAGEIQTARNKAISTNTNQGVIFQIVDANTYRYILPENPNPATQYGPLRDLPGGTSFVAFAGQGFRFDRLGRWCPGAPGCAGVPDAIVLGCPLPAEPRCTDRVPGTYVDNQAGQSVISVQEDVTGEVRQIRIEPGGRVRLPL